LMSYFAARDWDAVAQTAADNVSVDDRRRVVNAGVLHGRDAIVGAQATADVGFTLKMLDAMATRGGRLALIRVRASSRDPEAIQNDALNIVEIDADDRIAAQVVFDVEDFESAIAELDARYLAGEAAAHSRTWSLVTGAFAAINRHELPELTPDWVNIDHRHGAAFAPGDMTAFVHDLFEDAPDIDVYIEAVHRLDNLGVVVTHRAHGTSQQGFEAEWRETGIFTFDGDLLSRCELFDEVDLDAALARFDQLSRSAPRLENAASQAIERFQTCFAARDWDAMAEMMAEDISDDDRRRVVNAGVRRGRDAEIANMQAIAGIGAEKLSSTVVAIRGERLVLRREHVGNGERAEAFQFPDVLQVVEIGADGRFAAVVTLDLDDTDSAFAELDARYLAGEAAAHAHTWSVITQAYAAMNRHELPATTPDWVNIDHRRGIRFAPGDAAAYLRAFQDPQGSVYVETVHRLSNLGAVFAWVGRGTSQEGLDAEWRGINVLTVEGDLINRGEIFDEEDIDAAIARFEELHPTTPQLENAASQVAKHFWGYFVARDWDAMAALIADDVATEDRRRVVSAGSWHGRDFDIASMRATAGIGVTNATMTVIATRGNRLALSRVRLSGRDQRPEAFHTEALGIAEIDVDGRLVAHVAFDPDDFGAAFAELDARYLAGEAAAHSRTWSVITGTYAAVNRHEAAPTTPDWVIIDHLPLQRLEAGDVAATIRATWDLTPEISFYIEAVHGLSDLGGVVTRTASGTSHEGFEAEWRQVDLLTIEGDMVNRCEVFDEADVDAALARFDELHPPATRLENAANRAGERYLAHFAAGDWDGMAEILADDFSSEDRRRVVGAGVRHGRDAEIVDMRAIADLGLTNVTSTAIATRGGRLVLSRARFSDRDHGPEAVLTEVLIIVEINADERIVATVTFDLDEFDAAFEELDARYLAGDAAAHAQTWSVIAGAYAALNRRELAATTPDWVNIDHRRLATVEAGDLTAYIRASWDDSPDFNTYIDAVHRLSDLGAVFSQVVRGISHQGFYAEWRGVDILMVGGDLINRCERFDEADIDAALVRFDQLSRPAPQLENAASRMYDRYNAYLVAHDWDAMAEMLADDICNDDRRRVVSGGITRGRDAQAANSRAIVDVGVKNIESFVIATRGERLALTRTRVSGDQRPEAFGLELLNIIEIDTDSRIAAGVSFDLDDIDAAFTELDARYLAGEAAEHAQTWSAVTGVYTALNRHEQPAQTQDSFCIDRRPVVPIETVELATWIRGVWDLTPDLSNYIETVHRLSNFGAVFASASHGTSQEGFGAEWRLIAVLMFEGNRIGRLEIFDEADIDAALARFDELHPQAPRLENAASRADDRFAACFRARDWVTLAEILADDTFLDDRRRVVGIGVRQGRDVQIADFRAAAERDITPGTASVVATRGERLALSLLRVPDRDQRPEAFHSELLDIVEIDTNERIVARFLFGVDDIDAALAELDARYLAGEASGYMQTWSVIVHAYAAANRHELASTSPNLINIDHRKLALIESGDLTAYLRNTFDDLTDLSTYLEGVHRLTELGAVVTHVGTGTSQEGFDAAWRMISLIVVEDNLISRCEIFDETDLDAALARFEELGPPAHRLENATTRIGERIRAYFAARDWDAMAELLADDICTDDRRRIVGAGIRHGRDAEIAGMKATAEVGTKNTTGTVLATRGENLSLGRICFSGHDQAPAKFLAEVLSIVETNADNMIGAIIVFDLDDVDAAFEELDARYLAGEAAAHPHTWSLIAGLYAGLNRHELPQTTPDFVDVDNRRLAPFAQGDIIEFARTAFDQIPDLSFRIEAVHGLSNRGAVVTQALRGTSREGFEAEWREIHLTMI
ncbi:MAG: hypothetical protein QOD10_6040, partial [Mycobacterium sp.]|nr:hypothetical protein [Mycobacterium sp.]